MNNSQAFETESIVPKESGTIMSPDDVKAFFYLYNAKPDSDIRFLKGPKVIDLSDIRSLEERVADKLRNHNTVGETISISFTLSNRKIKDFSNWAEFERSKLDLINEKIEALNISWNFLIQLPQPECKSPQTHSMKLRIGNSIPPKDIFQLILTSDDHSELMQAFSMGVCKVDFINAIIANELLFIVDEWYQGLRKTPEPDVVSKFLKRYGKTASQLIRISCPLLSLFISCIYTDYLYPI